MAQRYPLSEAASAEFQGFLDRLGESLARLIRVDDRELDLRPFAKYLVYELYEQGRHVELREVFRLLDEFLNGCERGLGTRIAFEFIETVQNLVAAKTDSNEDFVPFYGDQMRRAWALFNAIWKTSERLDCAERSVLEAEFLIWRISQANGIVVG